RIREPAIVFTEYRDTLERLRRAVAPSHPDVAVLHGGLSPADRSAVQRTFNTAGTLLLATDAASEGLNLHRRCRVVVHYELPWSPARLEQRTGRVDRIGQSRTVHEIILVADDAAERLVLAPLLRRAARAGRALTGPSRLLTLLTESRVAAAIMDGAAVEGDAGEDAADDAVHAADFRAEADAEASRLKQHREWARSASRSGPSGPIAAAAVRGRGPAALFCVYTFSLVAADGAIAHAEAWVVRSSHAVLESPRTAREVREIVREFLRSRELSTRLAVSEHTAHRAGRAQDQCSRAIRSLEERERAIARTGTSVAQQLVQAGLFDQRALRAHHARAHTASTLRDAAEERMQSLDAGATLTASLDLSAVLVMPVRARR
ncbi:MAG: C-terminal helicase domain-containing protein, partial [Acidobacteriota bacterium]